jgi:hypothetical protein
MHKRINAGWKRKDGTRRMYRYYRCDGTPRQPSTCRNTIPAEEIEKLVNDELLTLYEDETVKVVSWRPADDPAGQIEDIKSEIEALDSTDRATFLPEYNRLMDEAERLEKKGVVRASVETADSKVKFGVHWRELTDAEKHDYLVRARLKVFAASIKSERDQREARIVAGDMNWRIEGGPREIIGVLAKKIIPEA